MRGKGKDSIESSTNFGITPACAGKSSGRIGAVRQAGDHPRVCGEKILRMLTTQVTLGSPPRVRGKALQRNSSHSQEGITPACAGKSKSSTTTGKLGVGSPPRVRGKVPGVCKDLERVGITPAYAGKSNLHVLFHLKVRDHPRVCGEKCMALFKNWLVLGSPPRMRGKVYMRYCACLPTRITPAYAGKRRIAGRLRFGHGDHPRVCGEKGVDCCRSVL